MDKKLIVVSAFCFALFHILFSSSLVSAVPEGYSCGYYPDSSPFCDSGLSCDYFQCVSKSDQVSCASMGGDVCTNTQYCNGNWIDPNIVIENWCCDIRCSTPSSDEGGWCSDSSDCDYGLVCENFQCRSPGSTSCREYSSFCSYDDECCGDLICSNSRCNYENPSDADTDCESRGMKQCYSGGSGYCVDIGSDCFPGDDSCGYWITLPYPRIKFDGLKPNITYGKLNILPDLWCKLGLVWTGIKAKLGSGWDSVKWWLLGAFILFFLWLIRPFIGLG